MYARPGKVGKVGSSVAVEMLIVAQSRLPNSTALRGRSSRMSIIFLHTGKAENVTPASRRVLSGVKLPQLKCRTTFLFGRVESTVVEWRSDVICQESHMAGHPGRIVRIRTLSFGVSTKP